MKIFYDKTIPRKLCEEVDLLSEAALGIEMSRRPWNRFKADLTGWWLIPSPKQPHYKFGKYFFEWGDEELASLIAGFYVEKGLDEALRSVYPSKRGAELMMKNDWGWRRLMGLISSGELEAILDAAAEKSGNTVEIHFDGGYVDDPTLYDPYASNLKNDYYVLEYDCGKKSVKVTKTRRGGMHLKVLNKACDLKSLFKIIQDFDKDQWLWLNVFIGVRMECPRSGIQPPDTIKFDAQALWENVLRHFAGLVR